MTFFFFLCQPVHLNEQTKINFTFRLRNIFKKCVSRIKKKKKGTKLQGTTFSFSSHVQGGKHITSMNRLIWNILGTHLEQLRRFTEKVLFSIRIWYMEIYWNEIKISKEFTYSIYIFHILHSFSPQIVFLR